MESLITTKVVTWAMLAVISYLVKVIVRVDRSQCAMEVRIIEHERRLNNLDKE